MVYRLYWPLIKLTECPYQITLKAPRIWINLRSLYTKMGSIEPLCTRINSLSLYTKTYIIEPYYILPILWRVMFLPYPDLWKISDEHLLCDIIFLYQLSDRIYLSRVCGIRNFLPALLLFFFVASTQAYGELVESAVFFPLTFCNSLLYYSIIFNVFNSFASSGNTPEILLLVFFLSNWFS